MSSQILEKLFGSSARVRIMKQFLLNPEEQLDKKDVAKKTKTPESTVQKELNLLESIGLIKKTSFFKEFKFKSGPKKKRINGFTLNPDFIYANHLKGLLINTSPLQHNEIGKKLGKALKVKLLIVSGIFIQSNEESRLDMLLVGDSPKEANIRSIVSQIESEIGQEIRYSLFSTEDFKYRLSLYDHLVRDVLDYPHKIIIDKIGLQ